MRYFRARPFLSHSGTYQVPSQHWTLSLNVINVRRSSISSSLEASAGTDGRKRLSQLWLPTGGIAAPKDEDSQAKLLRAGFLRQAHSGIFHMLPMGRRVQEKLESLIDKHMYNLGASKVSLSSISSQDLWLQSGRLENVGSELFQFQDRKEAKYLLAPTHEEEITSLVASTVKSYKELPIRLYQISRKYRDERRPRHGLLRSREFIMKDLYTFDCSSALALQTYHQVRAAYARLFDELKLPYLVAEADSGDMGGDLSHEFHFPTSKGEDHVISCSDCDYVANEERAESPVVARQAEAEAAEEGLSNVQVWHGISEDGLTLIKVWYASSPLPPRENAPGISSELNSSEVNVRAVKQIFPQLDPTIDEPLEAWGKYFPASGEALASRRIINLLDCTLSDFAKASLRSEDNRSRLFSVPMQGSGDSINVEAIFQDHLNQEPLSMLRIKDGDVCPRCTNGSLRVQKTIELGHTFHLGTRYSVPLEAIVKLPTEFMTDTMKHESQTIESRPSTEVPMQMGCHGIGVSRIVGAVADTLADEKGLNWPRVMAPFEVVVVPGQGLNEAALGVYDALGLGELDVVLDDRSTSLPWKLQDADLIGYPVIVIVGRSWNAGRMCEVQCRRLHIREQVSFEGLLPMVKSLLEKL